MHFASSVSDLRSSSLSCVAFFRFNGINKQQNILSFIVSSVSSRFISLSLVLENVHDALSFCSSLFCQLFFCFVFGFSSSLFLVRLLQGVFLHFCFSLPQRLRVFSWSLNNSNVAKKCVWTADHRHIQSVLVQLKQFDCDKNYKIFWIAKWLQTEIDGNVSNIVMWNSGEDLAGVYVLNIVFSGIRDRTTFGHCCYEYGYAFISSIKHLNWHTPVHELYFCTNGQKGGRIGAHLRKTRSDGCSKHVFWVILNVT